MIRLAELLLGLDGSILQESSAADRARATLAAILFACVVVLFFIGDAYLGYLYESSWTIIGVSGLVLGFIHFCTYRLALITMATPPLGLEPEPVAGAVGAGKFRSFFSLLFRGEIWLRILLVGGISLSACFPLAALLHHDKVVILTEERRQEFKQEYAPIIDQDESGRGFPVYVCNRLMRGSSSFVFSLLVLLLLFYAPLFLLILMRYRGGSYIVMLREKHSRQVQSDYLSLLSDSQRELDARFAAGITLKSGCPYADPPFNRIPRAPYGTRKWGKEQDFHQYLRGLS